MSPLKKNLGIFLIKILLLLENLFHDLFINQNLSLLDLYSSGLAYPYEKTDHKSKGITLITILIAANIIIIFKLHTKVVRYNLDIQQNITLT